MGRRDLLMFDLFDVLIGIPRDIIYLDTFYAGYYIETVCANVFLCNYQTLCRKIRSSSACKIARWIYLPRG